MGAAAARVVGRGSGVPVHGEQRGLHHVAFEIRQDLIGNEAGQLRWAGLLARLVPQAYQRLVSASRAEMATTPAG
jgi:predicted N-formylglutamate amidohydrolase